MTWRLLLLTIVVSLTMGVGCKKSSSNVNQEKTVSDSAPAKTDSQLTSAVSPVSDQDRVPATRITRPVVLFHHMKPPASFTPDQLLSRGANEFTFKAQAGQFLKLRLNHNDDRTSDPPPAISVRDARNLTHIQSMNQGFCLEQMFRLPSNDDYHVDYDPLGQRNTLHFSLLDADDPLINAGIRTKDFAIDFGRVSHQKKITIVPYEYICELGESFPAHVLVKGSKVDLRIMQAAGYLPLFPGSKEMSFLRESLTTQAEAPDAKLLPYASSDDAATVMSARRELIAGHGWQAWRWIEGQSQDGDFPGDYLIYTVEGLTNDGRFFFRMRAGIAHPEVKRLNPSDSVPENDTELRLQLEKALAIAKPDSFTPNLNQLDAVISSLKFLR
jgi:hypothetical protein